MTESGTNEGGLTQDELSSLFESIEVAQARARDDRPATVTLYDFRQGSKLSPDQMREAHTVLANLARVLRRTLGAYLNTSVWLDLQALHQGSGEQYLSNLPDQPIAALFELMPHTPRGVWHTDPALAFAAVHCMLGGRPENVEVVTDREISPLEAAVLSRFMREILDTWALTWPLLQQREMGVREVVGSIGQADVELRHEQVLMALLDGNIAGHEGRMWVGLPAGVVQMILRRAEAKKSERRISPELLRGAGHTPVDVHVMLARRRMWLSELRALREGTVIDLQQHVADPVSVALAGKTKFVGRTGIQRGRVSVEITGQAR